MLNFTGERIVPQADNCEPLFALKMYQEHTARYLFAAQASTGKRVLDVGCGVGYGAHLLALSGAASVTAFDIATLVWVAVFASRFVVQPMSLHFPIASM